MEVNRKIEEGLLEYRPIGFKKVRSFLVFFFKNLLLDLWKYFHGLKIGFGNTPKGLKTVIETQSQMVEKHYGNSVTIILTFIVI